MDDYCGPAGTICEEIDTVDCIKYWFCYCEFHDENGAIGGPFDYHIEEEEITFICINWS